MSLARTGTAPVNVDEDSASARDSRKRLRQEWGCNCMGDVDPRQRARPHMLEGPLTVIREYVEATPNTCPWKALRDPLVVWVFDAYAWFEKNQLAMFAPNPSHRRIRALTHLRDVFAKYDAVQRDHDRKVAEASKQG